MAHGNEINGKRYFWLKLDRHFFNNARIKKLRRLAGGDTYTIIYLKLLLLSIEFNGLLIYEGIEETFEKEMALKLEEDEENVVVTINYLKIQGLLEERDGDGFLPEAASSIGSETKSNVYKKARKALVGNIPTQIQPPSNQIPTDIEIEEDIDKEKEIEVSADESAAHTAKRFRKPTLEEVAAYCKERNNNVDPQRFIDFYESKGWKVGKDAYERLEGLYSHLGKGTIKSSEEGASASKYDRRKMIKIGNTLEEFKKGFASGEYKLREDEYLGDDGLPYCKKCNTKRFYCSDDKQWCIRCMCKCQEEAQKKQEEEEAARKRMEEFNNRKALSLTGKRYRNINQIAYFNYLVGDIDKAQAVDGIMDALEAETSEGLANEVDTYIASFAKDSSVVSLYPTAQKVVAKETAVSGEAYVLDVLDLAIQKLFENDVKESTKIVVTVSPRFYTILKKAYRFEDTNNSEILKNGKVGMYGKVIVKMSNNVHKTDSGATDNIMIRTQRAIAFAKPLTHTEAYRPEKKFADAVKGFILFDAKVVRPKEIININVKYA